MHAEHLVFEAEARAERAEAVVNALVAWDTAKIDDAVSDMVRADKAPKAPRARNHLKNVLAAYHEHAEKAKKP